MLYYVLLHHIVLNIYIYTYICLSVYLFMCKASSIVFIKSFPKRNSTISTGSEGPSPNTPPRDRRRTIPSSGDEWLTFSVQHVAKASLCFKLAVIWVFRMSFIFDRSLAIFDIFWSIGFSVFHWFWTISWLFVDPYFRTHVIAFCCQLLSQS